METYSNGQDIIYHGDAVCVLCSGVRADSRGQH